MIDELTPDKEPLNIGMVVVNILICVFGLFLNLLSLVVMITLKEYKKSSLNRYLIHLALADTLFLMTVPFGISETLQNSWNFPGLVCQVMKATLFINYYASIFFLMVMSVDRYTAVCKPFNKYFMKFRSARGAHLCSGLIWAVAIAGSIPVIKYSIVIGTKPFCRCQLSFPAVEQEPAEQRCKLFFDNMAMGAQSNFDAYFVEKCIRDIEKSMQRACREDDDTELSALGAYLDLSGGGGGDFVASGVSSGSGDDDLSYISSGDFSLPNYTYSGDTQNMFTDGKLPEACNYNGVSTSWHVFIYINFILFFVLPISVMALTYGLIIARLQQNLNKLERSKSSASRNKRSQSLLSSGRDGSLSQKETRGAASSSRKLRREQRVTLLCIILLIAFLICWLPFFAVHLIKISGISNATPAQCVQYTLIGSVLARMNSLLNPILYNFLGVGFCARLRKARNALTSSSFMSFNKSEQFYSKKNKQKTSMKSCSSSGMYPSQKPKSNDPNKEVTTQVSCAQLTRCQPAETEF